jgi:hypothetical protein
MAAVLLLLLLVLLLLLLLLVPLLPPLLLLHLQPAGLGSRRRSLRPAAGQHRAGWRHCRRCCCRRLLHRQQSRCIP